MGLNVMTFKLHSAFIETDDKKPIYKSMTNESDEQVQASISCSTPSLFSPKYVSINTLAVRHKSEWVLSVTDSNASMLSGIDCMRLLPCGKVSV